MILILVVGLILTTNNDAKEIAKLNEMDEHELLLNTDEGTSFPLLSYALKR